MNLKSRLEKLEQQATGVTESETLESLRAQGLSWEEVYRRLLDTEPTRRKQDTETAAMTPEEAYALMLSEDGEDH